MMYYNLKNIKPNTKQASDMIYEVESKLRKPKTIYSAYKKPSAAKVNAFYAIVEWLQQVYKTAAWSVGSANSNQFTVVAKTETETEYQFHKWTALTHYVVAVAK